MSAGCCGSDTGSRTGPTDGRQRVILWIALAVNATMFVVEIVAGHAARSASLQADALDFLADSANYAISLFVLGAALSWRARAALVKGLSMGMLGLWVIATTAWNALAGTVPEAPVMGVVGVLALIANAGVLALLIGFRSGDANMRSVWICSRNDVLANIAVVMAAAGVFGTGTGWPDYVVAAVMASLSLQGATQITRQALAERREARAPSPAA
ncbi:MAG: cation transporter [Azospirillaceae bacterium]